MNTATPQRAKRNNALRDAGEPFSVPLLNDTLPLETLLTLTSKKKSRNEIWYHHTIRFVSFAGRKLTLNITHEKETHTLTVVIEVQQLTISCSCKSSVTTLCIHAYEYLFNVARISG